MTPVWHCPHCGSSVDTNDRFCQDCGANVNRGDRQQPSAQPRRIRVELLLVAAAVAYAASATMWADQSNRWPSFKMPDLSWTTAWMTPKPKVAEKETKPLPPSELQQLLVKARQLSQENHKDVNSRRAATPPVATISKPTPVAAVSPPPVARQPEVAESKLVPVETATVVASSPTVPKETRKKTGKDQIEAVAEYNRLLADYFSRPKTDDNAKEEPPSYQEWLAGRRAVF